MPEGVEGLVPYKGSLDDVLYQILGGLRSGMGYLGARNLEELQKNAVFVRITHSGKTESHIHNLQYVQGTLNYQISK